jgi:RNA polymerase primary sigma factor
MPAKIWNQYSDGRENYRSKLEFESYDYLESEREEFVSLEEYEFYGSTLESSTPTPEESLVKEQISSEVERMLKTLTKREIMTLKMRFGIGMRSEYCQQDIGKQLDVTSSSIAQLEAKALRKLRHPERYGASKELLEAVS